MLKNLVCFNLIVRTINPMQISDIQASAGLLSMSKIKGPNIQKMRQIRSNLDNSDNAARLSYQICRAAFMMEEGLLNLGISLVKISFSLWRTILKNNNLSGINTYGIFFYKENIIFPNGAKLFTLFVICNLWVKK